MTTASGTAAETERVAAPDCAQTVEVTDGPEVAETVTPSATAQAGDPSARRPLRSDAARNRERIVAAAREVFSEFGLDASINDIAQRAQVGIGTLYRRFPTKEALIDALADSLFEQLLTVAADALEQVSPAEGFATYLEAVAQIQAAHAGLLASLWTGNVSVELRTRMDELVCRLLANAQAAGAIRHDIVYEDVAMVMWSLRGVVEAAAEVAPDLWKRHVELLLDGLKPTDHRLAQPPLSAVQLQQAIALRHRLRSVRSAAAPDS